jgi:hypothetical protein
MALSVGIDLCQRKRIRVRGLTLPRLHLDTGFWELMPLETITSAPWDTSVGY